ncbi:MAG: hypothetical protein KY466_09330 [Gemmatimonadetes bacterium]|nr:hypothetical protein [Gemmatimonadota bacterium]
MVRLIAEHALVRHPAAAVAAAIGHFRSVARPGGSGSADSALQAPASSSGSSVRAALPVESVVSRLSTLRPGTTRSFLARQLEFPRVRRAYESRAVRVAGLFEDRRVETPEVFFRVFKREQVLEVWARNREAGSFQLLSTYPVCKLSGRLGPKRRQGDLQIPEGFYEIDLLNPTSQYHLSMRVDYPNAVDRARGGNERLGGDIYIHGGCATIGCVPVTDEWIEEIYLIAVSAREAGQQTIPVHIFPTRLDPAGLSWLGSTYGPQFVDYPFWQNLQEGYLAFETTRTVPVVGYDGARYTFSVPAAAPAIAGVQ